MVYFILIPSLHPPAPGPDFTCEKQADVLLVFGFSFENSLMLCVISLLLYSGCDLSRVIHLVCCVMWSLKDFTSDVFSGVLYRLLK